MLCSCATLDVPKGHVVKAAGVVHRPSAPCYVLDREEFDRSVKYILAGGNGHGEYKIDEPTDSVKERQAVWLTAKVMVEDLLLGHTLEGYKLGPAFSVNSWVTPAEQHMSIIQGLAEWLLEREY